MRLQSLLFFITFFILYGGANYYIGLRFWKTFGVYLPSAYRKAYYLIFIICALSFFLGRINNTYLPAAINTKLYLFGEYWLAVVYYAFFLLTIVDITRVLNKKLNFIPNIIKINSQFVGVILILILIGLLTYGTINARKPVIRHYDVNIQKKAGNINNLHIVMVTDLHLGTNVDNRRLVNLADKINEIDPDLVLLVGDIIDGDLGPFIKQNMSVVFRRINPKYGIYGAFGNHEYLGGKPELCFEHFNQAGIMVLRDTFMKVDNSFYIVGRDDKSKGRIQGTERLPLYRVMKDIDKSLPIILLDHQPSALEESKQQGVDLQLSGHTHRGQIFPNNFITKLVFEVDWGYLRKDNYHVIVSCGFGTWGPPIRLGNNPEIVDIMVYFEK